MSIQKLVIAVFAMGLIMSLLKLVPILFLKKENQKSVFAVFLSLHTVCSSNFHDFP